MLYFHLSLIIRRLLGDIDSLSAIFSFISVMLFSPFIKENRAIHYDDALFFQPVTKNGVQTALTNHVIHTEYHVTSSWKCMVYCLSEMRCVSFNYFPQSNTCELNNSTGSINPGGLTKRPGTEYYEKRSHSSFLG